MHHALLPSYKSAKLGEVMGPGYTQHSGGKLDGSYFVRSVVKLLRRY